MSVDTSKGHPAMDYNEHNRTYAGFIAVTKFGVVFLSLLMVAMYVFLV
jgi:Bacterial aa3 type cytochrome c oxidase subunit IV